MDNEKIEKSIRIIKIASQMSEEYYRKPLIITYSGGKDSDVLLDLAIKAGVPIEVVHSITTLDAPETNRHVNEVFRRLQEKGIKTTKIAPTYKGEPVNAWKLFEKRGLPTRVVRFCCEILKESTTPNRFIATGVRAAESVKRRGRTAFETRKVDGVYIKHNLEHIEEVYAEAHENDPIWDCKFIEMAKKNKDLICNPIIDWDHSDIWEYIRKNQIQYNRLYDQGFERVGCVGCPMGSLKGRRRDFSKYPYLERLWKRSAYRYYEHIKERGGCWRKYISPEDYWRKWMEDYDKMTGQMSFDEHGKIKDDVSTM